MTSQRPIVGIGIDRLGWSTQFAKYAADLKLETQVFDMRRADWQRHVERCTTVIWKPSLDSPYLEEGMEKTYFIEHYLKKRIFPNWATFWHYDNKRAQDYLLGHYGVPIPHTFCSYSADEVAAYIPNATYPLVSKSARGASSENVHLLKNARQARREVRRVFREPLSSKILRRVFGIHVRWRSDSARSYVLWQEYIPNNPRDLRVTIIGRKYCLVFWRLNRPGDFRASGSGIIDYEVDDRREEIALCLDLCRKLRFDSMAFDIIYRDGKPIVLEMSYAFNDKAIYDAPGHFVASETGQLIYRASHTWPQDLFMRYVRECLHQGDSGGE